MNKDIDWYIYQISIRSDKYGDKLLKLMDINNVSSLKELTLEQVKYFYENLINPYQE